MPGARLLIGLLDGDPPALYACLERRLPQRCGTLKHLSVADAESRTMAGTDNHLTFHLAFGKGTAQVTACVTNRVNLVTLTK